jgi:uncharacterized RDD family membrane protein YckC
VAELRIETPEGVDLRYELAGAGTRSAAFLIDFALLAVSFLVVIVVVALTASFDPTGVSHLVAVVLAAGFVLLLGLYHAICELSMNGQSPGKRLMRIRVTGSNGYPARPMQHVVRALFVTVEAIPMGLPALASMASTRLDQRLGDIAAGTVVLRVPQVVQAGAEPFPGETWSGQRLRQVALVPAHASRLGAEDLAFLRRLLTRRDLEPEARRTLFVRAAKQYSERLGLGPFRDARELLRELYLFLREAREGERAAPRQGRLRGESSSP